MAALVRQGHLLAVLVGKGELRRFRSFLQHAGQTTREVVW